MKSFSVYDTTTGKVLSSGSAESFPTLGRNQAILNGYVVIPGQHIDLTKKLPLTYLGGIEIIKARQRAAAIELANLKATVTASNQKTGVSP